MNGSVIRKSEWVNSARLKCKQAYQMILISRTKQIQMFNRTYYIGLFINIDAQ